MKIDHAIVFGATGLIGSLLLKLLVEDNEVSKITAITRREMHEADPKVKYKKIDFSNLLKIIMAAVGRQNELILTQNDPNLHF